MSARDQRIKDASFYLALSQRGQITLKRLLDLLDAPELNGEERQSLVFLLDEAIRGDAPNSVKGEIQEALIRTLKGGGV